MINYDPSHFLLQQMDYLAFSDLYHGRIKAFHVKDAEFCKSQLAVCETKQSGDNLDEI